ncbi:MAG TPA: Ku protein [Longimicrobiales bacterium]|nr:Ku protein [Longimicrobiales bacterium]
MSARAIGTATVSFGLVSVPIKLYSTGDTTAAVSFNWIHKDCGSRLKQQYICASEGVVVERDDMVKGYEFARDQYVLFTPEELKALEAKADNTIEIVEFVPADKVDRVYLDKPYYLGPDKGGDRAYRLLGAAMGATGLSALGRYAARGKQYLVLLSPMGEGIVMEQLRYAHEVRTMEDVPIGSAEIKERELALAVQLIQQIAADEFLPQNYKDEVHERVLELIQRKIEGEDITAAPVEAPQTQIIDLMEALKASLARADAKAEAETPRKAAKRASPEQETAAKRAPRKKAAGGG